MNALAALILAGAAPLASGQGDAPRPVQLSQASVRAVIIRAERADAQPGASGLQRRVKRRPDGTAIVEFD